VIVSQVDEPAGGGPATTDGSYDEIYNSPEFAELRSRFRRLVFPLVVGFLAWYGLYVVCATYARDFMAEELFVRINVGLVFGLLQFASTFGIAYWYAKRAEDQIDARARALLSRFQGGAK
jgi:uncharacterized membrane protein (DUF485 family)